VTRVHPRAFAAWSAAALVVVMTSTNPVYRALILLIALNVLISLRRPDASLRPLFIAVSTSCSATLVRTRSPRCPTGSPASAGP